MQDAPKAVWSIPYVSVAFFPSLKQNFIAYRSSKVSDCIFEINWKWQSGFSRVYSNCCWSCLLEPEIKKMGQSSHKMYSNNIVNFKESTTILNACTKKTGNLLFAPRISRLITKTDWYISVYSSIDIYIYIYIYLYRYIIYRYHSTIYTFNNPTARIGCDSRRIFFSLI